MSAPFANIVHDAELDAAHLGNEEFEVDFEFALPEGVPEELIAA